LILRTEHQRRNGFEIETLINNRAARARLNVTEVPSYATHGTQLMIDPPPVTG
jgi:hypothetical protein